jgi:hypothetical protein
VSASGAHAPESHCDTAALETWNNLARSPFAPFGEVAETRRSLNFSHSERCNTVIGMI